MTVTERLMGNGAFSVHFDPHLPSHVLRRLRLDQADGAQIVITPNWVNLAAMTDADAVALSRYTGVIKGMDLQSLTVSGIGLNSVLGVSDNVGRSTGAGTREWTFEEWATFLTPASLGTGMRSTISGTFKHTYEPTTFRALADVVAARFDAAYEVTPDHKLNFGTYGDLFREIPNVLITRHRQDAGRNLNVRGLQGDLQMKEDSKDRRRRVVYFYEATPGEPLSSILQNGGVDEADWPVRGPDGSAAFIDEIVVDRQTDNPADANALSLARWRQVSGVRREFTLSSSEYDIGRDVKVGDNLYVFDPDRGVFDTDNKVTYRGQVIYPEVIRCVGYTWPIRAGMGVWLRQYRKVDSSWVLEWIDLTRYVLWESGDVTVEVGAKPRTTL